MKTRPPNLTEHNRLMNFSAFICIFFLGLLGWSSTCHCFEGPDIASSLLEAPELMGKDSLFKLRTVADHIRANKIRPSDVSFIVLDWADQYLREPDDQAERLKRWADLTNDEKLSQLKMPRDFLNRLLLAEYLINQTSYLTESPQKKLEILSKLEEKNLVDWSASLAYSRIFAGAVICGGRDFKSYSPMDALVTLKQLKDDKLIGWHYRAPTEAILVAELLAMDKDYQNGSPLDRLVKLRELERKGLIMTPTKKELEKIPVWRLLISDSSFMNADARGRREKLSKLRREGLLSNSTYSDLRGIFKAPALGPPMEAKPAPFPNQASTPPK
jgi:hypothetical protein